MTRHRSLRTVALLRLLGFAALLLVGLTSASTASAAQGPNLIANPSVETPASASKPGGWNNGRWGTNATVFSYASGAHDGERALQVTMADRISGDAKWFFDPVPVTPGREYFYSDFSQSSVATIITVRYTMIDGSFRYKDIAFPGPSIGWEQNTGKFTPPAGAVAATVFHLLNRVGTLKTDNFSLNVDETPPMEGMVSLTFDDGYMSSYTVGLPILETAGIKASHFIITGRFSAQYPGYLKPHQVLDLQARGQEVGSHSRTHPALTTLSDQGIRDEVAGSKADLEAIGITKVKSFAYPLGDMNDAVKAIVRESGYVSARGSWGGTNDKESDLYNLQRFSLQSTTTVDQVKQAVDEAVANRRWLVLVLHEISDNGNKYSTKPQDLKAIVDYLMSKTVRTVTLSEGVDILHQ